MKLTNSPLSLKDPDIIEIGVIMADLDISEEDPLFTEFHRLMDSGVDAASIVEGLLEFIPSDHPAADRLEEMMQSICGRRTLVGDEPDSRGRTPIVDSVHDDVNKFLGVVHEDDVPGNDGSGDNSYRQSQPTLLDIAGGTPGNERETLPPPPTGSDEVQ